MKILSKIYLNFQALSDQLFFVFWGKVVDLKENFFALKNFLFINFIKISIFFKIKLHNKLIIRQKRLSFSFSAIKLAFIMYCRCCKSSIKNKKINLLKNLLNKKLIQKNAAFLN